MDRKVNGGIMATNIEMNYYNGSNYTALYPKSDYNLLENKPTIPTMPNMSNYVLKTDSTYVRQREPVSTTITSAYTLVEGYESYEQNNTGIHTITLDSGIVTKFMIRFGGTNGTEIMIPWKSTLIIMPTYGVNSSPTSYRIVIYGPLEINNTMVTSTIVNHRLGTGILWAKYVSSETSSAYAYCRIARYY